VDFCWQATTRKEYEGGLALIDASGREEVYLDAPETVAYATSPCAVFYEKLREDLSPRFARTGTVSGWEVWRRRSP